jgi:probable F420-dependent oxidoreductase
MYVDDMEEHTVKFGVQLMGVPLRDLGAAAKAYEDSGFESVWVPEHLVFPLVIPPDYPYSSSGYPSVNPKTPSYDPWVILAIAAAATKTIRLATNVYILPLRHPLQTARSVVTLDRVSAGRVTLGVGVGWLPDEFEYVGMSFHDRGKRSDATIEVLRRLWSEEIIEVHDEHFSFGPVVFEPKPIQKPSIPIEVGGTSKAALRRAARLGDGWIEIGSTDLEDFHVKLSFVIDERRNAGREADPFEVTVFSALAPGLDGFRRLRDAGATRILVGPPREPNGRIALEDVQEWATTFGSEIIARVD